MHDQELRAFMHSSMVEAGALANSFFLKEFSERTKRDPADIVTEADEAVSHAKVLALCDR